MTPYFLTHLMLNGKNKKATCAAVQARVTKSIFPMRKCLLFPLLYLSFTLFTNPVYAQQIDSMMNIYADRLPSEKIHIHFDKSVYNKGETIWYKVYILQGGDTTAASMNMYLEWYDADGKLITQTVSPVVLSASSGSFDIPADYKGESLQVKAFTSWMLNDDQAFGYRRDLVINTNTAKTAKPLPNKTTVEIFPESGFLIQGLRTSIAFKATNRYGNPVFIKGVLVDDKNNILDSLNVLHDGMGIFYLVPLPGQTYQLKWIDEFGITGSTAVPVTKKEGAQLTITRIKDKALFQVERTAFVPENFRKMTLLIHMNRVGLYQVAINASEKNKLNSAIAVSDLPSGLLQFTLFTSDWIPIAERVIFINNRSHEFVVKVTAPLINVDKNGKNTLEVFVPDTLFTNMSLAITDAVISSSDQHTIFSDILLSSEINGKVYNPGYYLSGDADSVAANLDLVMLTNGWRRFDWDKIRAHIPPKVDYPSETEYMKLRGKVSGMKNNSPESELNLIVLTKDSSRQFISVPVEKDGSFAYPMFFFDTAKVFYSFNNNKSLTEKEKLQINNGLLQLPPKNEQLFSSGPHIWNSQAKQKLDALLAQQELLRKIMAETTLKEVIVTAKIKTKLEQVDEKYASGFFSGNGARRTYAVDFVNAENPIIAQTQSVLAYLQNRVPGLNVNCISMLNCSVSWSRGGSPDIYLNEMPATMDMILGLAFNDVALIKAFPPPFYMSSSGMRGGAIAVYTKKMEDYKQPEIKGLSNLLLSGYTKFKEFYSPSYEHQDEEYMKPDNRTTLYWEPYLITNRAQQRIRIEFFNNDFTKTFNVVLEGINAAGKMTRVVKIIDANTKGD